MTAYKAPSKEKLKLHPAQGIVYRNKSRFKVVVAGRRWGKTQLAKTKIIRQATIPRQLIWYVAPTYGMAKQIMWKELKNAIPRRWILSVHSSELRIELKNGSTIQCKGSDNPDALRGIGLNLVILDEYQDMHDEVWEECIRPTLASTGGGALFIGTPKSYNLLYDAYRKGQSDHPDDRDWCSWQFKTITSPFIPVSEIEAAKRDMDAKSFRQEFEASFEGMSGRVYHEFDRNKHIKECPFNPNLPIWIGQDFNIDPMSSVIFQPQPDGTLWAVGEIVLKNSNVQEVCDEIDRRFWRWSDQVIIYPDPAGKSRQHARGESSLDVFRERGYRKIKHRRKHPAIDDRVNAVNRRLMSAAGEIGMYVDPSCTQLIRSFEQTMYKPGSRDIDKSAGEEHITDAGGYCIEFEYPSREIKIAGISL